MRRILVVILLVAFAFNAFAATTARKAGKMKKTTTTIFVDTVSISNAKYVTPYLCIGYASYGKTMSSDSEAIVSVTITPFLSAITDSLGGTAPVALLSDTIAKGANCNKTSRKSLSAYFPAFQTYIVTLARVKSDKSDNDSLYVKLYLATPENK